MSPTPDLLYDVGAKWAYAVDVGPMLRASTKSRTRSRGDRDTRLDILHDYYAEGSSHLHEREKQRDRLFLVLSVLFVWLMIR